MTDDLEHLLMILLIICICLLKMCLFKFLLIFFVVETFVLLLSCKSSLAIWDTNLLSDICIANICIQSVACFLFHFLMVPLEEKNIFILIKSNLVIFIFYGSSLCVLFKLLPTTRLQNIFSCLLF